MGTVELVSAIVRERIVEKIKTIVKQPEQLL